MENQVNTRGKPRLSVTCPFCGCRSLLDKGWKPSKGYDPDLLKYDCTGYQCNTTLYVIDSRRHTVSSIPF